MDRVPDLIEACATVTSKLIVMSMKLATSQLYKLTCALVARLKEVDQIFISGIIWYYFRVHEIKKRNYGKERKPDNCIRFLVLRIL